MTANFPLATGTPPTAERQAPNRKQRRQAKREQRQNRSRQGGKAEALLAKAGEHHVAGNLAEAEGIYRGMIDGARPEPLALARLGALCLQTGRNQEAIEHLERARQGLPKDSSIRVNLAIGHNALGQPDIADGHFRAAAELSPEDAETQKNYGSWCHERGRHQEAVTFLERGLKAAPEDRNRQFVLGKAYVALGQELPAKERFQIALDRFPEDAEVHANMGALLTKTGELDAAAVHLAKGFPFARGFPGYQSLFARTLGAADPGKFGPELEAAMLTCLQDGQVDPTRISAAIGTRLWLKHVAGAQVEQQAGNGGGRTLHIAGVLGDPLLLELLRGSVNQNVGLEALLVPLRRALLMQARMQDSLSPEAMTFMACFAMHCRNNSYLYPSGTDEEQEVGQLASSLAERISTNEGPDAALETAVALYAMYHPLHALEGFERLLDLPLECWSSPLQPLIERSLLEPAAEQALKPDMSTFGDIADRVSLAVRSQYEENPYPRWVSLPNPGAQSLVEYVQRDTPGVDLMDDSEASQFEAQGLRALIAGCGTGKHPISAAMALPQASFTAVDLSLSSLAYAKRMAAKYQISNLEYLHGDLLQVSDIGRTFQLVESAGVLHHMEDPERGLASLMQVLEPGGFLRLGLYSKLARDFVTVARKRIAELGWEPSTEAIRRFRGLIIAGKEPNIERMVRLSDFFDLDSFRDLVFHVQEHQYTVPGLKEMLERQDLEFLGFTMQSREPFDAFLERFPQPGALADLDNWAAFEEDNPDIFLNMYQFWCRKPA